MEVLYERCCGIDVHERFVIVCLSQITQGQRSKELRRFGTTTGDLLQLRKRLLEMGCTHVAMESTGIYTPVASKAMCVHSCSLSQSESLSNSSVVVKYVRNSL